MHVAFLNPQGNFDPDDRYWSQHPDFGGQLVYVKQVALAMGRMGQRVDILTRRIIDPDWPEFAAPFDAYPGAPNVRIVRLPAGPDRFLRKEDLWPHLARDWVPRILAFYRREGSLPDAFTAHYGDGGISGALIEAKTGVPFTFTGHSLGAQKMDKLDLTRENLAEMDARYHFGRRIVAERISMNRSAVNVVSTRLERFEQYGHPAYRGAVDVHDDRRFAIIPPGVDLSIFDAAARSADEERIHRHVQERLARDLDEGRRHLPAIVASSRIDPKKNHVGLVRAFGRSRFLQEQANLVLITAGLDDPLRHDARATPTEREVLRQIRETVDRYGLWGKVSGFALQGQSALAAAYRFLARRGSVFALTSLHEPFGLAPLEAAAAGLPVVVTRNGGPSESLREGDVEYGVLVNPTNPADIAHGLERLLSDPITRAEFARRGRRRVLERYTWERTAGGYLTLIGEILRHPRARRPSRLLSIHPYFRDPRPETDVSLVELERLYWG